MNDFLLNLYTSSDDIRPLFMFPNSSNGIVYATDCHGVISIPENELSLKYNTNEKYPNVQNVIDELLGKSLLSYKVKVSDLAKELTKARLQVDKESITCKECKGSGTVEFEYCDKQNETHYIDGDCPICDGEGSSEKEAKFARIKLSMIENEDGNLLGININELCFHPFQLYRLFMVSFLQKVDDFEIFYDPNNYGMVISNFGNIKVITMLYARTS